MANNVRFENVVRKITPVFNILNPFCPRLSGDHFAQEHKTRVCMSSVSTKKENISVVGMSSRYSIDN